MAGPHPATAAVRVAVRECLRELGPGAPALVACSGGADSLALAEAAAYVARTDGLRVGAVVVDHGLRPDSGEVATRAAARCTGLGLAPVLLRQVSVGDVGGPEAAARTARYAALERAADETGAQLVLLGHTRDDQAEQVLLGLLRGSGARSLAGMPPARGRYRRPLLGISREQTRAACEGEGLVWWEDPMNADPAYARVRVRRALADLERDLGPGVVTALARTADQLREDADHLDALADAAVADLGPAPWEVTTLLALPRPVRSRVWRRLLARAGAPLGQVGARHTDACDALLTGWHGQGPVAVPGALAVQRGDGRVTITPISPVQ